MSYDISIGDEDFNYTYNMAKFFHRFIVVENFENDEELTGLQALNGLTGKVAIRVLERALKEAERAFYTEGRSEFLRTYDSQNGWGDTYSATIFLSLMIAACSRNKKGIVRVY